MLSVSSRTAVVVSVALAAALQLHPDEAAAQGKTQKISGKLVERAEDTVKEVEKTKKQVVRMVGKYNAIFGKSKVKDRQNAYKDLTREIQKTEDLVKDVRKRTETMQKEADRFFAEWSKGVARISDGQLRLLSHTNMTESRDRYTRVIESVLKAGGLYGAYVTDLKNQCSYLALDMSDTAMARLAPNKAEASAKAAALYQAADELTRTTKGYIASMK